MNIQPRYTNYVVSFSFKNYLRAKSGMPKVIMAHQTIINDSGASYVYLYSVKKTILNDSKMLFCFYGMIIDGIDYGVFSINQIKKIITDWKMLGFNLMNFHIHHLLFTDIDKIGLLLDSFNDIPIYFFLHDYYLCCKSYHLMDSTNKYCSANCLSEINCNNCLYFTESAELEKRLHDFINNYMDRLELIAPSESTREIYSSFNPNLSSRISVIPHQRFSGIFNGNMQLISSNQPLKIGYLGVPEEYKGWHVWKELYKTVSDLKSYKFYVFNNRIIDYEGMNHVNVEYSNDDQNAMVTAVRKSEINVVIFWAQIPETYSYTCMEAFASNAFIITNRISGNVQDFVIRNNAGIVLEDEESLYKLFRNPTYLRDIINDFRRNMNPGPLQLVDNDVIRNLFEKRMIKEKIISSEYDYKKGSWTRIIEFFYDHFVGKY